MQDDFKINLLYTSTGIAISVVDACGHQVAWREIGKAKLQHWVSHHADRQAAIEFDACISDAVRRDEDFRGNLHGIFDATAVLLNVASGVAEHVA